MADLGVVEAQVVYDATGTTDKGVSGEVIDVGEVIYKSSTDGKYYLAQADGTANEATVAGIAISAAEAADQRVVFQVTGLITLGAGAAPAQGTPYFLSGTAGKMSLATDIAGGSYVTYVGVGSTANKLRLGVSVSGETHV